MEGVDYGYAKSTEHPGALDDLDRHLEEVDTAFSDLERKLGPVRSQYATEKMLSEPRPEPGTALRGRIEQVRLLHERIRILTNEIDL